MNRTMPTGRTTISSVHGVNVICGVQTGAPLSTYTTTNGVKVTVYEIGDGAQPAVGQTVKVHYIGKLKTTGKVFDTSRNRTPFQFPVAKGTVIRGWD